MRGAILAGGTASRFGGQPSGQPDRSGVMPLRLGPSQPGQSEHKHSPDRHSNTTSTARPCSIALFDDMASTLLSRLKCSRKRGAGATGRMPSAPCINSA